MKTMIKNHKKEIENITNQIVKKYKPEKIILYGSFAYGKPHQDSDVDLLIVKETKFPRVKRIKKVLMKVESNLPLEPLVYTPKELDNRLKLGDFFVKEIVNKGKVVYEK